MGGQIPAAELANRLSVTSKTLERKFAAYIGKTPRQYSKLIRFRQILKDISSIKNVTLTEHAFRNGYFDQSHFIRL
jgi:AraC-like DNA-binding protein